jgi:hypothetical protein
MLDRTAPSVTKMAQFGGVLANPYAKVRMEQIRVYAQLGRRALEEPGMKSNLLAMTAWMGLIPGLVVAAREYNGVNQDEVDQSFASAPPSVRRFKPGALALWDRDKEGRLTFADLTQSFEPMAYLQGNPETAAPLRILQNLAMSPVDGSLIEPELQDSLSRIGLVDAPYREKEVAFWQRTGAGMLADLGSRFLPGIARNTYNTLERGGMGFEPKMTRAGPATPQSPLVTTMNMLLGPNRLVQTGGRGAAAEQSKDVTLLGVRSELIKAKQELWRLQHLTEGQSTGSLTAPLNKTEALKRAEEHVKQKAAELDELENRLGR